MKTLENFQRTVAQALIVLGLVHVAILVLIAWMLDRDPREIGAAALLFAAVPLALFWSRRSVVTVALALAVALVGQTSLLVYAFDGHPWQIEMHFYYFAVLAMLSGFCEWRVLILAAALISLHHLGLNVVLPAALYPGGSDFLRVVVHAVVVIVEVAMLMLIGQTIRRAFMAAQEARRAAETAHSDLEALTSNQKDDLASTATRADRLHGLLERFNQEMTESIEIMHANATGLQTGATNLGVVAARASAQSATVSVISEDTARKVKLAADAGQEMALTIAEVGSNAARSSQLAGAAVTEAEGTNATIDEMATVASEIGKVTELISAIAAQTNLLALNATIEAARAGEYGRGFAVVAQEVKALAGQTAKATADIASRIAAMQATTARSVSAIQSISRRVRELNTFSARIASAVEQQAEATRNIGDNVNSASAGVSQVESSVREIEAIVEKNTQAVADVSLAANEIASHTGKIRQRVQAFTQDIQRLRA
jgi:methyl-accepting chemotaxis protein